MRRTLLKKLGLVVMGLGLLGFSAVPVMAHSLDVGAGRWYFGRDQVVAALDLGPALLAKVPSQLVGSVPLEKLPPERLNQWLRESFQPYVDQNLRLTVNGQRWYFKVVAIDTQNSLFWRIWLRIPLAHWDLEHNSAILDYQLFEKETNQAHVNNSFQYNDDPTARSVADIFQWKQPASTTVFGHGANRWAMTIPQPGRSEPLGQSWAPLVSAISQFALSGIEHILTGFDHIAFLLALVVIGLSMSPVIKMISAFTLAHSLTLLLAALQIVSVNSRLIESLIAFSICYVAIENWVGRQWMPRWVVSFGFGLIHGFGFAGALSELLKADQTNLVVSVVSFNVGVELGQLLVFLAAFPVFVGLSRWFTRRQITLAVSSLVLILGSVWLVERVWGLTV